jgi:two-component system, OmpR family, sensor histidine kinase KdpD
VLRAALAISVVVACTFVLVVSGADLAFAAIALLLTVAGASVFGYTTGLCAAVTSVVALTYYFTPPTHSFRIDQPDDILALIAFVAVSLLVGATIARLNELRTRAEVHARESSLRVTLTHELRRGIDVDIVLRRLATELDTLFDLTACTVTTGNATPIDATAAGDVLVHSPPLLVRLTPGRPLTADDLTVIRGLAAAVAASMELERLDAEARDQRLRGALDQSRAALLNAVTHDVRTPLATIKAASGALLDPAARLDDDERRELLEDTWSEATRLERLVDKVLEMGRIRSGALRPDPVPTAPIDLVQSVTSRRSRAVDSGRIVLAIGPDLPAVDVDVVLLEHVLTNLLENAAVHAACETPIEVRGEQHGDRVRVAVIDRGTGVPAADRERIFDEFVRRDAPTDGTGTGLGLTIVRALVEAHDGSVWCEETPGGGATFVIELAASDEGGLH